MRGETRTSALWGRGGRSAAVVAVALFAFVLPLAAAAEPGRGKGGSRDAFVPKQLREDAERGSGEVFRVIVQRNGAEDGGLASANAKGGKQRFDSIGAVAAELTGEEILELAKRDDVAAITEDAPMVLAGETYEREWPFVAGVPRAVLPQQATIAIVDSGIDVSRADFGGRVIEQVTINSLPGNGSGDGRGHGTFVAGLAAGNGAYPGAAENAKLVSIDVVDDQGMALTSDVIAAADWIIRNKDRYGIRVANFSLHSSRASSFLHDPLDKAVEKLWFSGVVVVVAVGNYASGGQPSGVAFAPANDPFVITVGANDIKGTKIHADDQAAPWSAYGYTLDGFAKPDLVAPGRYLVGPVPPSSTMALEHPERLVAPGYMWMSGTSFAAPIVAGGAAHILAHRPGWSPDLVKGAMMAKAVSLRSATPTSVGIGEVKIAGAAALDAPPNPNLALNRFVVPDPAGGPLPVFDAQAWVEAAKADPSWDASNWTDSNWTDSNWTSSNWTDSNWTSSNWTDSNWTASNWTGSNWTNSNWVALSWVE